MRNKILQNTMLFTLPVLPVIAAAVLFNRLPQKVAVHFNLHGDPDRYGSPVEIVCILAGLAVLVAIINLLLARLIKKKYADAQNNNMMAIRWILTFAMTSLGMIILFSGLDSQAHIQHLIVPVFMVMLALLGNYMVSIKPNYWVGIRTPRTLRNENVWRKTHRFFGKWLFYTSLVALLPVFLVPVKMLYTYFIVVIIVQMSVGLVYSFIVKPDGN